VAAFGAEEAVAVSAAARDRSAADRAAEDPGRGASRSSAAATALAAAGALLDAALGPAPVRSLEPALRETGPLLLFLTAAFWLAGLAEQSGVSERLAAALERGGRGRKPEGCQNSVRVTRKSDLQAEGALHPTRSPTTNRVSEPYGQSRSRRLVSPASLRPRAASWSGLLRLSRRLPLASPMQRSLRRSFPSRLPAP
jgi:hypothetical protein